MAHGPLVLLGQTRCVVPKDERGILSDCVLLSPC